MDLRNSPAEVRPLIGDQRHFNVDGRCSGLIRVSVNMFPHSLQANVWRYSQLPDLSWRASVGPTCSAR